MHVAHDVKVHDGTYSNTLKLDRYAAEKLHEQRNQFIEAMMSLKSSHNRLLCATQPIIVVIILFGVSGISAGLLYVSRYQAIVLFCTVESAATVDALLDVDSVLQQGSSRSINSHS